MKVTPLCHEHSSCVSLTWSIPASGAQFCSWGFVPAARRWARVTTGTTAAPERCICAAEVALCCSKDSQCLRNRHRENLQEPQLPHQHLVVLSLQNLQNVYVPASSFPVSQLPWDSPLQVIAQHPWKVWNEKEISALHLIFPTGLGRASPQHSP